VTTTNPTDYYALQRVVSDLPVANSYTIVNYDEEPLEFNSTPVVVTIPSTKIFPYTQAFNSDDPFTLYKVLSKYIITKSPFKLESTSTSGVYTLVDLDGIAVDDPGTNDTTKVLISWNGSTPFPFNARSNSGYEAFIYTIIGRHISTEGITASETDIITDTTELPTNPQTYNFGGLTKQTDFIPATGPVGTYSGETLVTVNGAPTGPTGPAITNNISGKVTAIFGGINKIGVETTMNDWTILYTQS
jgi:hypothetical protein